MKPRAKPVLRRIWLYKKADFEAMNDHLDTVLDDTESLDRNVDSLWLDLKDKISSAARLFIPSKLTRCGKNVPWLTKGVRRLMRLRDKTRGLAKKLDAKDIWQEFRRLRNKAVSACPTSGKAFPPFPASCHQPGNSGLPLSPSQRCISEFPTLCVLVQSLLQHLGIRLLC